MSRATLLFRTGTTVTLIFASLTACSGAEPEGTAPTPAVRVDSIVDKKTGRIQFPSDQYYASTEEIDALTTAGTIGISRCAQAQGVDFRAPSKQSHSTLYDASDYFGVWVEDFAERFGFAPPMTFADMKANGVSEAASGPPPEESAEQPDNSGNAVIAAINAKLTDEDMAVVNDCAASDAVTDVDLTKLAPAGAWSGPIGDIDRTFYEDDVVKRVVGELNECLEEQGLTPTDQPGFPVGADATIINEKQIVMAVQVVDCKTQVKYVDRLAERMAELQAPVINRYETDLQAQRARIDAAVESARKTIADQTDE